MGKPPFEVYRALLTSLLNLREAAGKSSILCRILFPGIRCRLECGHKMAEFIKEQVVLSRYKILSLCR